MVNLYTEAVSGEISGKVFGEMSGEANSGVEARLQSTPYCG
jgi:hypothetical protein